MTIPKKPSSFRYNPRALYFPEKLVRRLEDIFQYPLTILHAPSGFGKTTAVNEYLSTRQARVISITAEQDEEQFCGKVYSLLALWDADAGAKLRMLGPVRDGNYFEILTLLRGIVTEPGVVFILDNYQLIESTALTRLIFELFSTPEVAGHMIILTQSIDMAAVHDRILQKKLNYISKNELEFGEKDVNAYFKLCGVPLTKQEQDELYHYTEGWVAALYLQMLGYLQKERFEPQAGIGRLVETAVMQKLSAENQRLLHYLCRYDGFTLKQAVYMAGDKVSHEEVTGVLEQCALVRYDYPSGQYYMHEILRQYLLSFLEKQPSDYQDAVTLRMARWYAAQREYLNAMRYLYELGEYDEMLSLPIVALDIVRVLNRDNHRLILDITQNCPAEAMQRNPRGLVILAFGLLTYHEKYAFSAAVREFYQLINRENGLSPQRKNTLKGEMAFILSLSQYNDINRMSKLHRHAYELIRGPVTILSMRGPWTFGSPSVLYMFYRECGKLDEEQARMDECMPYYYQLAGGHGSGAEEVMRAEALFFRGDFETARVTCHRAAYMANTKDQHCITICVLLLLARIAIMTQDTAFFLLQLDELKKITPAALQGGLRATVDLCEGYLYALLGQGRLAAGWLRAGDTSDNHVQIFVVPYENIVYGRILLAEGEYQKLIGLSQPFLSFAAIFPNLLSQVYINIYTAAAFYRLGNTEQAKAALLKALTIALPDRLYLPFAENGDFLDDLLETLRHCGYFKVEIAEILRLSAQHRAGTKKIAAQLYPTEDYGLTGREREVAKLAAKRLSNKEIAALLYISENTVKFNLKAIYQKLQISSRGELAEHFTSELN